MLKLHIGCGDVYLDGWVNVDIDSKKADLIHDVRKPLPYKDNSVDFIYSEALIEHFTVDEVLKVLTDFHRILKPKGVLRIATIDLDYIAFKYFFFWKRQDWIETYGYSYIKTKAEMMNAVFYFWGHKWIYNFEELKRRVTEAGFKKISRKGLRKSGFKELTGLETRKDMKLILEAIK